MFECPLSVLKCMSRAWMSNRLWLKQNAKHRNMFHVKRRKCKKKKMVEKSLILNQYQSADLKSFWNWFGISDLCKNFCKILLSVWAPYKNFRLALMILTLPLNKIVRLKCILIQRFFLFCTCRICFGVEKNVPKYSFINKSLWNFRIISFL